MAVTDLITPANVKAYARAAIQVARTTLRLARDGYETLIVPSRGSVPIVSAARHYERMVLKPLVSRGDRLKLASRNEFRDPLNTTLHLPYTADAGPTGVPDLTTADVRGFWTRVLAAIARQDLDDPHYRLFRFTRDVICRVSHHDPYERFVTSGKFIFVDTVVSGRAVAEIAEAFDRESLSESHFILLLDENGERLRPEYATKLRSLEAAGRATLIYLDSLFTEDQGPAVSGVWSVVAPSVMEIAREQVPAFDSGLVGSGLYYHEVKAREDQSNVNVTIAIGRLDHLLFEAVQMMANPDEIAEDLDFLDMNFENELALEMAVRGRPGVGGGFDMALETYLEHITKHALFDQGCTVDVARPRLLEAAPAAASVDVSSSHCLRLNISRDEAAKLVRSFKDSLNAPYHRP